MLVSSLDVDVEEIWVGTGLELHLRLILFNLQSVEVLDFYLQSIEPRLEELDFLLRSSHHVVLFIECLLGFEYSNLIHIESRHATGKLCIH